MKKAKSKVPIRSREHKMLIESSPYLSNIEIYLSNEEKGKFIRKKK